MKRINVMLKPASSLCNLRCKYCFYHDVAASRQMASMGIMEREAASVVVKNIYASLAPGDELIFSFQGGEPGLAGLDFFEFFVNEAKKIAPQGIKTSYSMQTNGLMIDKNWCEFFIENQFLIGLSLDGDAMLHQNRLDSNGKSTFNRVMTAKKLLDTYQVPYNILCVLTTETSRRAAKLWNFIKKERIKYIQFIPCLESLSNDTLNSYALTGNKFFEFYSTLFPLWQREAESGNLVNIRLFDDISSLYLSGSAATCGISGRCYPQIVVESDGSVYPCDFYVLDEYKVADLTKQTLREAFETMVKSDFFAKPTEKNTACEGCTYYSWCQGGCKRMAKAVYGNNCGMKLFLDKHLNDLLISARIPSLAAQNLFP